MMRITIVTPAPPHSQKGNRITALRWGKILRKLGHRVKIDEEYVSGQPDLLIALHARRSSDSIARFHDKQPDSPLIVAMTGTDLYHDLKRSAKAKRSLKLADRLVLLQPHGISFLPKAFRSKARAIFQSAPKPRRQPKPRKTVFEVSVIGHLRDVKDPFRTALAGRLLPERSRIRITHVGFAMSESMSRRAEEEMKRQKRYRWLGGLLRCEALQILQRSRLTIVSSKLEGAPNTASEALAASVPILATHISGMIGMLGENYPGYFPTGDTQALADLMLRCEKDVSFYMTLQKACHKLKPIVDPKRERESWRKLLSELK